jgi:hypothetical protein
MSLEIVLSPRDESMRSDLAEAQGWGAYVSQLRGAIGMLIEASRTETLEVGDLYVGQPLPDGNGRLRNGMEVDPAEALNLVVGMAAGDGHYCSLAGARIRIETGWDGAIHLSVRPEVTVDLDGLRSCDLSDLSIGWCTADPAPTEASTLVGTAADSQFWAAVRAGLGEEVTLLCERWAHGAFGYRWFRLNPQNCSEVA